MTATAIIGKPPSNLQFIGYVLRLAGPATAIIAALAKLLLRGPDAVNICVFIGVVLYGSGFLIKRYF